MPLDDAPLDLATLPAVLAGPVLRNLTRTQVAVWVALSSPGPVTLHVRPAGNPAQEVAGTTVTPTRVGTHLWLAVATVGPPDGAGFAAGRDYEYRLSSPAWAAGPAWGDLALGTPQPAFPGPPAQVRDLVVLHTSCRKLHGGGRDGLATAADLVTERLTAGTPEPRPHLLVLSGDQIYADEIPGPLAARIRRVATDLVGIDETAVFGPLPRTGARQLPSEGFGLTSSAAANHLWTFGEYLATYLLSWSDVLWPAQLPTWADVGAGEVEATEASWTSELAALERFRSGLPAVRRVLATVPGLMVLDDHEVTDDWNLDHGWATAVYGNPAGSRVVTNGLLAYALCQHWGNVPDRFATPGTPEARVLTGATFTGASPDTPAVRAVLGVPAPPPAPPCVLRDPTDTTAVRYDVGLGPEQGWPVRVVALDERTVRQFVRVDHPAARVAHAALALVLPGPPAGGPVVPLLLVAPSPVLGTHVVEHVLQPAVSLLPGGSRYADFESWPASPAHHQDLFARLAAYSPVVAVSGDVHYSTTAALTATRNGVTTHIAGVTSSSAKNADTKTMVLHLLGDFAMRVGLERTRGFAGFTALSDAQRAALVNPPPAGTALAWDDLVDVLLGRVFRAGQERPAVLSAEVAAAYGFGPGDWSYVVEPVDDETPPDPGPLLTDLTAAPPPWVDWDPAKSFTTLRALRAGDLHRIGRVWDGLPQISLLTFAEATPTDPAPVRHTITSPVGEDVTSPVRHTVRTRVGSA